MGSGLVTKGTVISRGWSEAMIGKFLGEPDLVRKNPHYRDAAPMRLYLLERVLKAEESLEFQRKKAGLEKRKEAARKGVKTKFHKTLQYIEDVVKQIQLPVLTRMELIDEASQSFRERKGDDFPKNPDEAFLQRICVNFLRHEMTDYEFHLEEVFGKVGTGEAYARLKRSILNRIAQAYPWLSGECRRQKNQIQK